MSVGCIGIVVAAGRGHRLGGEVPKQYRPLGGRPLLRHCLETLSGHRQVDAVRVVFHPDDRALYEAAADGLDLLPPVAGGATRQESVRNGLESLAELDPTHVLIHDAARPFLDAAIIDRILAALEDGPGAIAALPVVDTLKREAGGAIAGKRGAGGASGGTVDRRDLWRAQTPQGFRYREILAAHQSAPGEGLTDDAAVAEAAGLAVALVMGAEENFKVTTEEDLARAERMLTAGGRGGELETRTGLGFDVHRFGPGDHVWLCGVRIDHGQGLIGHSDADVGLHALTDAVLGAVGAGDIGQHFPPSDPQWRDAASDRFLAHACALAAARGARIASLDVTLVCERPRIGPHRARMVARVAEITGLPEDRVSVKATTTEGLGFTGRGEGIAAQAIASVRLPASNDGTGP